MIKVNIFSEYFFNNYNYNIGTLIIIIHTYLYIFIFHIDIRNWNTIL